MLYCCNLYFCVVFVIYRIVLVWFTFTLSNVVMCIIFFIVLDCAICYSIKFLYFYTCFSYDRFCLIIYRVICVYSLYVLLLNYCILPC